SGPDSSASCSASGSVRWAIRPRQVRSSNTDAAMGGRVYRQRACYPAAPMSRTPRPRTRGVAYRGGPPGGPGARARRGSIAAAPLPAIVLGSFALLGAALFAGVIAVYAAYTNGLPDVGQV